MAAVYAALLPTAIAATTDAHSPLEGRPVRPMESRNASITTLGAAADRVTYSDTAIESAGAEPGESFRPVASEFEQYVSKLAGIDVRRIGSELKLDRQSRSAQEANRQPPPDYLVGIGDEFQVTIWGSVDADLRLTVDSGGRIVIPRVGPVVVAGVRYADLSDLLSQRVGRLFKNFQLSVTSSRLRSIRYYVTGFAPRPGAYTVSSLATVMTGLLQAGGPAAAGSFREIELRRRGKVVSRFDLYDLIVKGDKSGDVPLQADDVLHIGPIGPQVAVIGSVNKPAVVELKETETVADAMAYVGGFTAVADQRRIAIERLVQRNDRRVEELALPADSKQQLFNGDVLRAFSGVEVALPQLKQYKRVRVEGEVSHPGDYLMPPASTLQDAIQTAGGLTPQAYMFGAEFSRESVRKTQTEQYDRALRDLDIEFSRSTSTQKVISTDEAGAQAQRVGATTRLIDRLKTARPTGRVVLQLEVDARELPALAVEDGDRLHIPTRPNTVGVFGSVFNAGSYLLRDGSSIEDVMKLAGGSTRGADAASTFVIRANGTVLSARQSSGGWLGMGSSSLSTISALPGDTVFVPEEMDKTTLRQDVKDWTQILYQFGIGAAALKTIRD